MKAIVLTADRYRAVTEHMILKYEEVWPNHPFVFRIPYQVNGGANTTRVEYIRTRGSTPAEIPGMILDLISDLPDDELIYWCADDKYPIRLLVEKIESLLRFARSNDALSGLLFCRTRALLGEDALLPHHLSTPEGETLIERRAWNQIWIHQLLRTRVLRNFFSNLPSAEIASAVSMDSLKDRMPKPADLRLFVTERNFAVFGESTHGGRITRNCLESMRQTSIAIPEWFEQDNGETIILGRLPPDKGSLLGRVRKRLRM